jgi:energy-coupling factor transporter ATP-binding protein EcfA2
MIHEHIRESRNDEEEKENANKHLKEIKFDLHPPCSRDIGAFSPHAFEIIHYDPLDWRGLPFVKEEIPPYSFCTSPYRRMFSEEPDKTWEYRPEEQLRRLEGFWSQLEEKKSLIFFYVNHGNPLKEEKNDRILVGIGRILKIGPQLYFGKKKGYEEEYPIWSRCITHNFPEEGIRLPYQEYLNAGLDPSNIICTIPSSARSFFSYVAEHVSDDVAVGILERVIHSVNQIILDNKVPEPYGKTWKSRLEWLNRILEETWKSRGRFPGIGSVLEYLGFNGGIIYHRTVLSPMEAKGENILNFVISILEGKKESPGEYRAEFKKAISKWNSIPVDRRELLKILCHFELSPEQVDRISNPTKRIEAGINVSEKEIIKNPYLISELDEGESDSPSIDFETIDRGMIPGKEHGEIGGLLGSISKDDNRRVRALLVKVLKDAAQDGDTCLLINETLKRVEKALPENRRCVPDFQIILYNREFFEERLHLFPTDSPQVIALKAIRTMEEEIRALLERMIKKEYSPLGIEFWKELIDKELEHLKVLNKEKEERARKEKVAILDKLFSHRFSVLTGRAGTGKTTVLKALIKGIEEKEGKNPVLLLAPTGKARVRLKEITKRDAQTIHQFLMKLGWIKDKPFRLKEKGGRKESASTIIIDESSMIPLDLLATLFRAIDFNDVRRLILVGDHNQLPPIGPGRPFVDIIKWLESSEDRKKHICYLTQKVRHEEKESEALKLADAFLGDTSSPADDEILSKIARGDVSGDLEVYFWNDEKELYDILYDTLGKNLNFSKNSPSDYNSFNESLDPADKWQILSPTRMQFFGTTEINRRIQKKYRGRLIEKGKRKGPKPLGDQQIVWEDKVIQIVNQIRNGNYIANGEIGRVVKAGKDRKRKDFIEVSFSTQQEKKYRYYGHDDVNENLELAYAITVHKSQGSDFDFVFLIVPQNAGTMSRELLYTGITRFRKKMIVLIEKDINPLLIFRKPQNSEILKRNSNLFELAVRPETIYIPHPHRLIHRTKTGVLVRSKSEVIIANILTDLGISYEYEKPLYSKKDSKDFRLPDFTIKYEGEEFYWEHLGMLEVPEYRKEWESKEEWYKENNYIDRLIVSKEGLDGRIDSKEIERLAKEKILKLKS